MIRAVLFDLDGTLLDTAADLIASLNHVRAHEGLEPVAVPDFRHLVSRGAAGLISAGLPPAAAVRVDERKQALLAHYAANSTRHTVSFEGIDELLAALAARGVPWGVVTNKPEYLTLPILQEAGLLQRAACVVCGDTLSHSKPHPAPVRLACEIVRVNPAHALMVGDDLRDIQAGQAAGTQTALAAYGYLDPGLDVHGLGHCPVIDHPREILLLVDRASVP
jgi:phosphoglycolate phosphatase